MKTVIRRFDFETATARFALTIFAKGDGKGFVGEYFGSTPKFAGVVKPGSSTVMMSEIGSGKVEHTDLEELIAACRAQIEEIDGPIQRTGEREV
jgi:hypothetical protein